MSGQDWSRFAEVAREYAEAADAVEEPSGTLSTFTERDVRRREAAERYWRELRRLGFDGPGWHRSDVVEARTTVETTERIAG